VNYDPTNAANNSTADQFTITGNYTGTAGSLLEVDLDLTRTTDAGGLRADRLNINGVSGGQTNVGYNIVGNSRVFLQQPILVVNTTPGSPVDFNGAAIPSFGLVNSDFVEFTPGQFGILSTINAAAAIGPLAAITAATTSINTGFFQGSSAFITGPTDPRPNHWAWGPWIRYSAGESRVDAHGVATLPFGGNQTADARVKNDFSGFQVGVDTGLYNINGSGYSAHLGVTAGVIDANARERVGATSVNFDIPYFGVYGAITGNGFSADLSVRRDNYNMRVTNETARVFRDKLDGEGTTVNASIAYKHQLSNSFFVEPSAQLIWSRTSVDSLDLGEQPGLSGNFGQFRFRDIDSLLGRVGVRVGTTFQLGSFGVQPFMAAHLWHEFEDHAQATFVAPGNVDIPLSVNRVGTFGQVGAGVSAQLLQTGLFGFVRGDVRFGDRIEGTAFNAGLRYQF
jgi:outer membrane autotransporter protein